MNFKPSYGLEYFHHPEALALITSVIEKLEWTGVANFDLRYDEVEKNIKVLEMNTRFWGNLNGPLLAGVNFPYLSCLVALNIQLPIIEIKRISYVTSVAAKNYYTSKLLLQNKNIKFDKTVVKFILQDPGPYIFMAAKKSYHYLSSKF
jgi:predicted ATP-grasp superfamily ATP-dependent carboligase